MYNELIDALRNCACIKTDASCANCGYARSTECKWRMIEDAADALKAADKRIAELEAQLSKEGEWIDGDARKVTARCSVCGHLRLGNGAKWANMYVPFCEICGARMQTVTDCHTLEEGER